MEEKGKEKSQLQFSDENQNREEPKYSKSKSKEKLKEEKHVKDEDEKEIKNKPNIKPVPFLQLYRFTTTKDRLLILVAIISALVAGTGFPSLNVLVGEMADLLVDSAMGEVMCNGTVRIYPEEGATARPVKENDEFLEKMSVFSIVLGVVSALQLVSRYLFISIFSRVAERQVYRLRQIYLRALLRQNVGWYDTVEDRSFISKISEMITKVQEATGDKVGLCVFYICNCLLNLGVGFYYGWLLSLVILASTPVIAGAAILMSTLQTKFAAREQKQGAETGKVSEEALSNIRTVMAFSGQEKEMQRYEKGLLNSLAAGKSRGLVSALGTGFLWFLNYASYSLAFWYGTKLIFDDRKVECEEEPEYKTKNLMIVFFSILTFSFNAGHALSYLEVFSVGRIAAATIYNVIDRTPEIDSYADTGRNPTNRPTGKIQFRDVSFSYPSRKEVPILRGLNLTITPGSTVAFVGNSGCGKSTTLQLLQRFYDPDNGTVLLDDTDIRDLNISWLRSQLGVVSQEPILFNTTIAENVGYGMDGVGQAEIEAACRFSNAHAFISNLPNKYETIVGDRGAQLSGGQKQRIAIARAIVGNPSILLLDEATSALDTQSESIVQQALDKASKGRTTLIVAHRLSTIRKADVIVSIQDGQVSEIGTHEELLARNGLYSHLVKAQVGDGDGDGDDEGNKSHSKVLNGDDFKNDKNAVASIAEEEIVPVEDILAPISEGKQLEDEFKVDKNTSMRLLKLNLKEWPLILVGLLMSIAHGSVLPIYALYFGEFMDILSLNDPVEAQEEANKYAIIFLIIGAAAGITLAAASICFSFAGEALTNRLRQMVFKKILFQDVAWFDNPKNSVGALTTRLAGDTAGVQGATGSRLGTVVQTLTTLALAAGISLWVLPKAGAVACAFVPVIVVATFYNSILIENQAIEEKAAFEQASKLAFQAVSNIRTVASLCKERTFVSMYSKFLDSPHKKALKQSHMMGFVHGLSEASLYCSYAIVFYYGAYLITHEDADYKGIFIVGEALIWSMLLLGQTLAFAPNYNKAKVSGARILKLLDAQTSMDAASGNGLKINSSEGRVTFDKAEFSYPSRPEMKILKGLSLGIEPNLNLGICGPSGSGKSTCIQLILRYYDPTSGQVLLDEKDVSSLNLVTLRKQMALVAQEPALFDRTIRENIAYGDNSKEIPMPEVINAAKSANIHEFIASLPSGYETRVGEMGAQLSGGQKQRIAIARALVRNPKLLLLDEATSALDTESEKVVQAALEKASSGRTCITIAHRLSSIQNADKILVVNNGVLTEGGTHTELLNQRGIYFKLWNMQGHSHSHSS